MAQRALTVYLGLGSNLGDRSYYLAKAIQKLSLQIGKISDTSFLYESQPKYHEDQPMFLNAAVKLSTTLSPKELLCEIKKIEDEVGRQETFRNGPRILDIDILLYGDMHVQEDELVIPHTKLTERSFVLRPLCDMNPDILVEANGVKKSAQKWLDILDGTTKEKSLVRVLPLGSNSIYNSYRTIWKLGFKSVVMGIINVTPDSFSNDGTLTSTSSDSVESVLTIAQKFQASGASILDIGACSTRPNAVPVSIDTEKSRIIPILDKLGEKSLPYSVDTFQVDVASEAIKRGAMIINDVSGGCDEMNKLCAGSGIPLVITHSNGFGSSLPTPVINNCIVSTVRNELNNKVRKAIEAGLPRWNIIVDPGIGFSKSFEQNLELIRNLKKFKNNLSESYPVLVGPSRKKFIGDITNRQNPRDRIFGTAAAVTACVEQSADIIRVHDVENMVDVCKVADKIYRL